MFPLPIQRGRSTEHGAIHEAIRPGIAIFEIAMLTVVYVVSARFGLLLDPVSGFATLVWAPTGLAIAALLVLGYRVWPGIAFGAFIVNAWVGAPGPVAAGIALGNTLEAVAAAAVLRRFQFHNSLDRVRDVVLLAVAGAGLSTLISATIGVTSLSLGGGLTAEEIGNAWLAWWWGDLAGALLVTPLLLTWASGRTTNVIGKQPSRVELVALGASLIMVSAIIFYEWGPRAPFGEPHFLFPLLTWASCRFGPRGAATITFLVSAIAISATVSGLGPFIDDSLHQSLLGLQSFMAVLGFGTLVLAALTAERARATATARDAAAKLEENVHERTADLRGANIELMQRAEQLRSAEALAHLGSFEWDIERDHVTWSDELYRICGLEPGVPMSRDELVMRVHRDDRARVRANLDQALADRKPFSLEHRLVRPDGSVRAVRTQGKVELARMLGTVQDITELRRAEQVRSRLAAIVETTEDAVIGNTVDGVIETWNRGAEKIYGYKADEAIGRPMTLVVPEDGHDELFQLMFRVRNGERFAAFETRHRRSDGTLFDASVSMSPIVEPAGGPPGISTITRDVTEYKKAMTKFRRFVEAAPDAMVIVDAAGTIMLANSQAERLFGYRPVDLVGRPVATLIPERMRAQEPTESFRTPRAMGSGLELFGMRSDGTEFPVEISVAQIETEEGMLVSAAIRDITERKIVESQLKDSVAEKDVLLREIHHRVKNNLQVIASLLQLQASVAAGAEALRGFEDSQSRIQSMALVHQLLYQSKDLARIEFAEYLRSLVDRLLQGYGIDPDRIAISIHAPNLRLDIDTAVPCGLIVNELVSNSFKHAFPDGRKGHVSVSLDVDDGRFVLVVADDGIGIAPDEQLDTGRTLGLQIVRTLSRQLRGTIDVIRTGGTTFRITFVPPGSAARAR